MTISNRILSKIKYYSYFGFKYQCNCCGSTFNRLAPMLYDKHKGVIHHDKCPKCSSLSRQRFLYYYLQNTNILIHGNLLHVAPDLCLSAIFRKNPKISYFPLDKFTEGYNYPTDTIFGDILNLDFADNSFDYIICSHVLEHIEQDKQAMKELYRVIKPGGQLYIQVPFDYRDMTYENPEIINPADREIHFGQFDHVRIYGFDLVHRLESVGFKVTTIKAHEFITPQKINKHVILNDEIIFKCEK